MRPAGADHSPHMSRHDRSDPHSRAETPYPLRRLFLRGAAPSLCAGLVGLMPAFQAAITGSVEQAFADRAADLHRLLLERASGEATPARSQGRARARGAGALLRLHRDAEPFGTGRRQGRARGCGLPPETDDPFGPGDVLFAEEAGPPPA